MKVRLKEDINIKELAENSWNGCRNDTLEFIKIFYNAGSEQDIFVTNKSNGECYSINTGCREYKVNIKALEIIEEDKEIEEVLEIELLGQPDNWLQKRGVNIISDFELNPYILEAINRNFKLLYYKQCELVKVLNELKKGK